MNIARLPTQSLDDEWCDVCSDDNIAIVIQGTDGVISTDNQITLCYKCFYKMQDDIKALSI